MGRESPSPVPVLSREALRQCVIAGARRVIAHREHLDAINVFPVPDRDTGTNLAATMRAVLAGLRAPSPSLSALGTTLALSALEGAQGNSGVILAQYFQGLREGFGDGVHLTAERFATAMKHAAARARQALAQPREGTILTVMSDVAEHLASACKDRAHDFRTLIDEGLQVARRSLAETPQRLATLRHAGVVDAGALGFVHFLEGIRDHLMHGAGVECEEALPEIETAPPTEGAPPELGDSLDFRYCTEAILRGATASREALLTSLASLGDSVVVAGSDELLHVHVHTNVPAMALELLADRGQVASTKVDDMWASLPAAAMDPAGGTALVTDSVCDLPLEDVTSRRIHVVPLRVAFGEEAFLDRVSLTPRQFYTRLAAETRMPTTSQPSPADFETLYRLLARRFAAVVSVHLSSNVSGTADSARRAATCVTAETGVPIAVIDSRSASAGEACVVWAAAEAQARGLDAAAIARAAEDASQAVSLYVYVPTVRYFVLGGRLSPLRGRIARVLRLLPILTMREGRVVPAGKAFGQRAAKRRVVRLALRDARPFERPLFVLSHSHAAALAEQMARALRADQPRAEIRIADAGPALGTHSGPGGVVIAVMDLAAVERSGGEGPTP